MKQISIPDGLHSDITEYCRLNGLKISQFCSEILSEGLSIAKYGDTPFTSYDKSPIREEEKTILTAPDDMIVLQTIPPIQPELLYNDIIEPREKIIKKPVQENLSDTATPEKPAARKLKRKLK